MNQKFQGIFIESIAACVPKKKITGADFDYLLDSKELRKFEKTTGILERRYVDENTTASDLGFMAAKKILESEKDLNEIKVLIFLSQTSDYKIPFTSNILQDRLGLSKETLCLDINAGCAGFVQGLSLAYAQASSIENGKVLLIVSETLSKILSPNDRSTTMLFGDAGSAALISRDSESNEKSYFNFFSDGKNYDAIIIPEGGYRNPFNSETLNWKEENTGNKSQKIHLTMDGPRVFDFTLREIPKSIEDLFKTNHLDKEDIDAFLFHQSNRFIIKQIASRLGVSNDKLLLNIDKFGNTSGVTIPLLMVTDIKKDKIYHKLLLSGYGSGLNWGNCIIPIGSNFKNYDLIEI
ncbi:3-oxoacyl-ACP synthase [Polaribacter pacificus]|uniref:3-oxoacyl-ACP synthase n=1 Tax=Polaribacter pacificus TaxID=1775173 RepID=A0A917I1U2_9FLAO|nr:ketoacyl-ACP synthase III [Polaribacter pacificus]GGH01677.1 3-oxoacyl-ACP synthase [Polaribacter pacificus]